MRHMFASRRLLPLAIIGLVLTACGGDGNGAADNNTDTLAVITPTPISSDASSQTPDVSTHASADEDAALVSERPPTTKEPGDDPDAPWGKDLPVGSAPTAPPAPPSDFDADGDGFYNNDELAAAIRYRFSEYEWPEESQITADIIIGNLLFGTDDRIEAPGEYTIIGMYHMCGWQITLLNAVRANDDVLIDESIYQLVEFGQNQNPLSHDENGKATMRDIYDRAVLGDVAPLQQAIDANCERMRQYFPTPDSATPPSARTYRNNSGATHALDPEPEGPFMHYIRASCLIVPLFIVCILLDPGIGAE